MGITEFLKVMEGSDYMAFLKEKALTEGAGTELHHIYLRKFEDGEVNTDENLVRLKSQDHLEAHLRLVLSLQQLGDRVDKKTLQIAIYAVNALFNVKWTKLTSKEQAELWEKLPELGALREQAMKSIQQASKTEKALARLKQTNLERYGHVSGKLQDPEVKKKAHKNSYNYKMKTYGNGMGKPLTGECKAKSKQTRLDRYGDTMVGCHTKAAQQKAHQHSQASKIKLYGNGMGKANLPETREKHRQIMRRKKTVVRTEEFLQWFRDQPSGKWRQRNMAVAAFLQETGRSLKDYPEYQG